MTQLTGLPRIILILDSFFCREFFTNTIFSLGRLDENFDEYYKQGYMLDTHSSPGSSRVEIQIGRPMYATVYADNGEVVNVFHRHILTCISLARHGVTISPYSTICQSSGCGKSRLMMEIGRHVIPVYIRCRNSQGLSKSIGMSRIEALFERYESDSRRSQPSGTGDKSMDPINTLFTSWIQCLRYVYTNNSAATTLGTRFADIDLRLPEGRIEFARKMFFNEDEDVWMKMELFTTNTLDDQEIPVIFCFDESRDMCKDEGRLFRFVRRALRSIVSLNACGIFADTSSSIVNFALPTEFDPSIRDFTQNINNFPLELKEIAKEVGPLFPPFVLRFQDTISAGYEESLMVIESAGNTVIEEQSIATTSNADQLDSRTRKQAVARTLNAVTESNQLAIRKMKISIQILRHRNYLVQSDRENALKFLRLGRPVWPDVLSALRSSNLFEIVVYARKKLVLSMDSSNLTAAAAVAVLASRSPVFIPVYAPIADTLMSSHMAYCMEIDIDKQGPYLTYISEPAIACGASLFMSERVNEEAVYRLSLPVLKRYLPSFGMRGEFAFSLCAIRAFDRVSSHNPTMLIAIESFLEELIGASEPLRQEQKKSARFITANYGPEVVRDRFVSLAQFIKVQVRNQQVTEDYVLRLAARGLGIIMADRNAGYDFLIPLVDDDGEASAIFVEVKNGKSKESPSEKLRKTAANSNFSREFRSRSVFIFFEFLQGQNQGVERVIPVSSHDATIFCPEVYHFNFVPAASLLDKFVTELLVHAGTTDDYYLKKEFAEYMTIKSHIEGIPPRSLENQQIQNEVYNYYDKHSDESLRNGKLH